MFKSTHLCTVNENVQIASETYKLLFHAPHIADTIIPGQFVHIKLPYDNSLLLRRPFSVSNAFPDSGILEIIYRIVGQGTLLLSQIKNGSMIDVLGPLGNGFQKSRNVRRAFAVGGGCGIAPLKLLIKQWDDVLISSFLGFKSKEYSYDIDQFELLSKHLYVTTDDGSLGEAGVITDLLESALKRDLPDIIVSCGPTPMLHAVKKLANKFGIGCQVSLEERMGCGIGGCLVCVCKTRSGGIEQYKKVCTDGPVFWSEEVVLEHYEYHS